MVEIEDTSLRLLTGGVTKTEIGYARANVRGVEIKLGHMERVGVNTQDADYLALKLKRLQLISELIRMTAKYTATLPDGWRNLRADVMGFENTRPIEPNEQTILNLRDLLENETMARIEARSVLVNLATAFAANDYLTARDLILKLNKVLE
jgi:hypothetical protein